MQKEKNTTLRETGIIGSLRWWYEALIRRLGGKACDPTTTQCRDAHHCDACELFGCTGWARKFRLEVEFSNPIPEIGIGTREKRNNGYLKRKVSGLMSDGTIILKFIPIRDITSNEWALLSKTLQIIANYGALGAKTSQGNGVIKIIENNLPNNNKEPEKSELNRGDTNVSLPNLNNFFFYKFNINFKEKIHNLIAQKVFWTHAADDNRFQDNWENWEKIWNNYHFIPVAFHIRDCLRPLISNIDKRHNYFGELGKGSRIFVSYGYRVDDTKAEIRVWGYNVKDDIKEKIKKELGSELKEKLFANENHKNYLESCTLSEEKEGNEILGELR